MIKGTGRIENRRDYRDHPDNSNVKITLNTEQSPGDLRRLSVTRTPVKDQLLIQMQKLTSIKIKDVLCRDRWPEWEIFHHPS